MRMKGGRLLSVFDALSLRVFVLCSVSGGCCSFSTESVLLEQWLMWHPERSSFHIRKIMVFCLLSEFRLGKWPNLRFHTNTHNNVLLASVHRNINVFVKHTHTHYVPCTSRHTCYTVVSALWISLFVTHTVKVMAFLFHCVTGDPKYLRCLA